MSAVPPPDENAAGSNVVPLRTTPPTVELGPVSPELAMVDPELARAARELLPEFPRPVPVEPEPTERPQASVVPIAKPAPPRRHRRLGLLSSAAGVLALGVLLTVFLGREERSTPRSDRTQSVAAAVSPPVATVTQPERAATTPAKPAGTATTPASSPPVHATEVPGQTFVWVASADAAAYEFQLFQGGERIFRTRVEKPRLELPGRWRQDGQPHALLPGTYRWYVWMISKGTNRQATKPTVSAKLVVDNEQQ